MRPIACCARGQLPPLPLVSDATAVLRGAWLVGVVIDRRSCAKKTAATASTCDRCVTRSGDESRRWRHCATPRWKRCGTREYASGRRKRWRVRSCWRRSWKLGDSRSSRDVRYVIRQRLTTSNKCASAALVTLLAV